MGLEVETAAGVLSLEPWTPSIIHVRFAAERTWSNPYNIWVSAQPVHVTWTVDETPDSWVLKTDALQARVRKRDAALTFVDNSGAVLLSEGAEARRIPTGGPGPVTQAFETVTPLYGLGQHQNGLL